MPTRIINDAPWPEGLYPLSVRGMRDDGEWLHGSEARVTPDTALWYEDRTRVNSDEWRRLDHYSCQVNLLAAPGDYTMEFRGAARGDRTISAHVDDPYSQMKIVPWLGERLCVRVGTWDEYIAHEGGYTLLEIEPGDVVADLGAHIGVYSRRALRAGASVVAWEPDHLNRILLEHNFVLSGVDPDHWEIVEACVVADTWTEDGVRLWMDSAGDGDQGRTALYSMVRGRGARLARRVPAVRWGEELERVKPTVLKVDVEGAELSYDWSRVPSTIRGIAVEIETSRDSRNAAAVGIERDLRDLGFELLHRSARWSTVEIWRR